MKRLMLSAFTILLATPALAAGLPARQYQFLSDVYTIDKKYRSMEGPASVRKIFLLEGPPELLWVTGVKTEMVAEDGETPQLPELMCHVNVDLEADRHRVLFNFNRTVPTRLVTLSQGMTDTRVPEGFGFPLASNEPLIVYTQVLNHNIENPDLKVRHRVTVEYIRDRDLEKPIKPLMNVGASGMVILDENPLAIRMPAETQAGEGEHGATCLMLQRAPNAGGMGSDYVDPTGRKLTGHWIVPPGRQVNHSDVTWFMNLPFDTKLHYAAVHLHPFAESLTLRDVTADKTIFVAKTRNPEGKVGLDHVDTFLSREGVQLYKDHQYELISVYDNPTDQTHDSMASIFFGFADRQFVKPKPEDLIVRTSNLDDAAENDGAVIRTSAGDFAVRLEKDAAPEATKQFARMLRTGMFKGSKATRIVREGQTVIVTFAAPPLAAWQRKLVHQLPEERGVPHQGASLSFCPSADKKAPPTFDLVIGTAPSRDGRCTAFASAVTVAGSPALMHLAKVGADDEGRPVEAIEITGGEPFVVDAPKPAAASM